MSSEKANNHRITNKVCEICDNYCGIQVHSRDGIIDRIVGMQNHPENEGHLCIKSSAARELLNHPKRLKHPLKRVGKKGKGKFVEISWNEALDTISQRLLGYKKEHGPQSVVFYRGATIGYTSTFVQRLANAFGSSNFLCESSVCFYAGKFAEELTFGQRTLPDWKNSDYLIIWSSNPLVSGKPLVKSSILNARKRGSYIVTIDPRLTETAQKADTWISINPGTDGALALGMMNVIITEKLYDADFVEKWTVGFPQLKKLVEKYTPHHVKVITNVPSSSIIKISREYATTKKAAIHPGNALSHHSNGVYTRRILSCLMAITGHIDVPGGNIWPMKGPVQRQDLKLIDHLPPNAKPALGQDRFSFFLNTYNFGQCTVLADAILTGKPYPIKTFLEFQGNAMMWPDSNKFFKALETLDFHVVINLFMTPSAKFADIVLPATTFLERVGANSGTDSFVFLPQPAVEPMYECWPDYKIIFELAKRLNLGEYFWDDIYQAINDELVPQGLNVSDLKANPEGIVFPTPSMQYRKFEENGFQTPTSKVELFLDTLKKNGYNPLPVFIEPIERSTEKSELTKKYPLSLITGERILGYTHSTLRNIVSMRKLCPEPLARINFHDASVRNIEEGNRIIVETPRGAITLKAKVTKTIKQGVVSIPHGWEEANVNILTGDLYLDSISGFPPYNEAICQIKRL